MKQSSSPLHKQSVSAMRFVWLKDDATLFNKIQDQLTRLALKKCNSQEIAQILTQFHACTLTYRQYSKHQHNRSPHFETLLKIYGKQLPEIYAQIAKYILNHKHNNNNKIDILRTSQNRKQFITKADALLMLCLMAIMLVPVQPYENIQQLQGNFHHVRNFQHIFTHENFKTRTIVQYLKRELTAASNKNRNYSDGEQQEWLIIERVSLPGRPEDILNDLLSKNLHKDIGSLNIQNDQVSIQEFYGHYKTDFANKYIGGGALTRGLVQEQIMFAVHPEMYVSMPICERMADTEALRFYGFQKYFETKGYNNIELLGFNKKCDNPEYKLIQGRRVVKEYITAIDAVNFNRSYEIDQYSEHCIAREIAKAYIGFNWQEGSKDKGTIITGNWGCGVFGGNVQLKLIIQWIAASLAHKNMIYCPFGSKSQVYNEKLLQKIGKCDIRKVITNLIKACRAFSTGEQPKRYNLRSSNTTKQIPTIYSLLSQYLLIYFIEHIIMIHQTISKLQKQYKQQPCSKQLTMYQIHWTSYLFLTYNQTNIQYWVNSII